MFTLTKTVIDDIPMPYAVNTVDSPALSGVIFASEDRDGPCRLYPAPGVAETVWSSPGGVMNVIPDGDAPALWSIQKFFPVFQSAEAEIVRTERQDGGVWKLTTMARLPYVHRIARIMVDGNPFMLACTLCEKKDFEQDWSHPGAVYISPIVDGEPLRFMTVLAGLTKNHGLTIHTENGRDVPLVSSADGVFRIDFSLAGELAWSIEKIHDRESSEAILYDLDNDGHDELITIDGFHGDKVHFYKQNGTGWDCRHVIDIAFGHVLWVGEVLGRTCILTASRSGDKDTLLHLPAGALESPWERVVVDRGVGATQIAVTGEAGRAVLFASNHGANEVAAYTLTESDSGL